MDNSVSNIIIEEKTNSSSSGRHYASFSIKFFNKVTLDFHGMATGCGIMQCRGNKRLKDLTKEELEFVKNYLKNEFRNDTKYNAGKVGMIIATLGPEGKNDNCEEFTLAVGFEELTKYNNWFDSQCENGWISRIYGLKPNYRGLKNI